MHQNQVAISSSLTVADHRTVEYKSDYVFVGEGSDEESAKNSLKEFAFEHNANAILDYKVNCHKHKFSKRCRYVASGFAAMIDGDTYKMKNGRHINIDKKLLRVNSPNAVQIRYLTVLFISLLFIATPILVRVAQRLSLSASFGLIASAICALLLLGILLFYFPNKKKSYLIAARRRHSI